MLFLFEENGYLIIIIFRYPLPNTNTMKTDLRLLSILLVWLFGVPSSAQNTTPKKKLSATDITKNLISQNRYVFQAQSATPMSGRIRQLTSEYDVLVLKDTVTAYLPYFGRAYTAPMNPTDGGIKFTSTRFTNTTTARKKGGWDVIITPTDVTDVRSLSFTISEDGYTTLQVISNSRQPISFYGLITAKKAGKK